MCYVRPSIIMTRLQYNSFMKDKQTHLDEYLALCKRIYERMERDGSWPWKDSTLSEDLVESDDNPTNI